MFLRRIPKHFCAFQSLESLSHKHIPHTTASNVILYYQQNFSKIRKSRKIFAPASQFYSPRNPCRLNRSVFRTLLNPNSTMQFEFFEPLHRLVTHWFGSFQGCDNAVRNDKPRNTETPDFAEPTADLLWLSIVCFNSQTVKIIPYLTRRRLLYFLWEGVWDSRTRLLHLNTASRPLGSSGTVMNSTRSSPIANSWYCFCGLTERMQQFGTRKLLFRLSPLYHSAWTGTPKNQSLFPADLRSTLIISMEPIDLRKRP
jgi:hypothetical protein